MTVDIVTLILALLVAFILGVFVLPQFFIRRAIRSVIRIFEKHNAIGVKNAKTIEELGLAPKPMFQRMFSRRDYKPQALQALIHADIVKTTETGKLYLSEQTLLSSRWRKR